MNSGNGKCFTCPMDRRVFKTKAALAQHKRASHNGSQSAQPTRAAPSRPRAPRAPGRRALAMSAPMRSQNAKVRVVSGSDIIGTFTVDGKMALGTILAQLPISPINFEGTRLHQESTLWARWRPQQLQLTIASSAGFMVTGSYMVGWTADSSEPYSNGSRAISRVGALVPSLTTFIGQQASMNIPSDTTQKWLYVDSREADDSVHGKVVVVLNAQVGTLAQGSITLTATLKWRVAFEGPRLQGGEAAEVIYADSEYAGYHTTSTSDWASGTKLSLKAHAGGGLVPFPNARPQTVYAIDAQAKLEYYKEDGTTLASVKYGVLIPNFSVKAMAVFETKDKAVKYAASGDSTHCLVYKAAGPVVQPDNPAWTEVVAAKAVRMESDKDRRIEQLEQELLELKLQLASSEPGSSGFL